MAASTTYDRAKEQLKNCLVDYLERKGININKPFKCLNPAHADNKPSMNYDKQRNKVHCFSCGADYDIIDLIQLEYGISNVADAFKKGYELFNIRVYDNNTYNTQHTDNTHNTHNTHKEVNTMSNPIDSKTVDEAALKAYFDKCHKALTKTSYLKDRGISDRVANLFNIGFDENFKRSGVNWKGLIIPTTDGSYVVRNTNPTDTDRYRKVGNSRIFNMKACEGTGPVFIVEGEIDALSIIEAGYNAIALGSTANAPKFISSLGIDKPSNLFILCLDNDNAGQEAQEKIRAEMQRLNLKHFIANIAGMYKDANEALVKDREAFITSLQDAINGVDKATEAELQKMKEEYQKNYASNCIQDFLDGIKERANTPYIPTGYKELDKLLDGGLFEGLYFIGAVSSLGKTTFTLQMADQIAQQGYDVLVFSLEMSKHELIAKSLSRLTLLNAGNDIKNAKTTRGITTYSRYPHYSSAEVGLINTAVKQYSDYANHIVIHEGQGDIGVKDIKQAVEKHINLTGNKPIVIVDYLQIIAPYNDRATDKQNTDKAVTELKRISRDCKLPIIAISSFNRDNYNAKVSMLAFKESGAIEYSSDVLIGLQFKGQGNNNFDVDEAKKKSNDMNSPREIELKILKNRNGRTGDSVFYDYYSLFNYFKEQ